MSLYPEQIDNSTTLPIVIDNVTNVNAAVANALRDAIISIEQTLGTTPESIYGTVKARLDYLEAIVTSEITTGGDISGLISNVTVIKLQGHNISNTNPNNGDILTWVSSGNNWSPQPAPIGFSAGGDLTGTATSQQVISLTGTSNIVNIPSPTALEFGMHSIAAQIGFIRVGDIQGGGSSYDIIAGRNHANSSNINVISVNGLGSTIFGDYTNFSLMLGAIGSKISVGGGSYEFRVNGGDITLVGENTLKVFGVGGPFVFDSLDTGSLTEWLFKVDTVPSVQIKPNDIRFYVGASSPTVYAKISDGGVGWWQMDVNNSIIINSSSSISVTALTNISFNSGASNVGMFNINVSTGSALGGAPEALGGGTNFLEIFNTTVAPTGTPTNAGVLFVQSGALKYLDTTGTVTTIAPGGGSFTAGGDLSGTSSSQQVISLTGASSLVNIPSASLEFGSHSIAATTGEIRFGDIQLAAVNILTGRNNANNANYNIIHTLGDQIMHFGDASYYDAQMDASNAISLSTGGGVIQSHSTYGLLLYVYDKFTCQSVTGQFVFDNPFDTSLTGWQFNTHGTRHLNIDAGGTITIDNLGTGLVHASSVGALTSSLLVDADVSSSAAITISKLAAGTSAQILLNNSTPTPTWTTVSGDAIISNAGVVSVLNLTGSGGSIVIPSTGANIIWNNGVPSPTLNQGTNPTNSATGQTLTIQAQNMSGTTSIGGALTLTSGTGTSTNGLVHIQSGGIDIATVSSSKLTTKKGLNRQVNIQANSYQILVTDDIVIFSATGKTATFPTSPNAGDQYTVGCTAVGTSVVYSVTGPTNSILWIGTAYTTLNFTTTGTTTNTATFVWDGTHWTGGPGF